MKTRALAMAVLLSGCIGGDDDGGSTQILEDARQRLGDAAEAVERGRAALELLGLLPDYTCGEPRATFLDGAADGVTSTYECASATLAAAGPEADQVIVTFASGCEVLGHDVEGTATFTYAGGTDRMDLEADFRDLTVDGTRVDLVAGYGTCGDETTYWSLASGVVPGTGAGATFELDAAVAERSGTPIIGSGTLLLEGTAAVTRSTDADPDSILFDNLEYESGELLPHSGMVAIDTAGGRHIQATFTRVSPLYGRVIIVVDDGDPVTVPLW